MSAESYRSVEGPVRYPDGRCPNCGAAPHHFPKGLTIDGTTVYWSCLECDQAVDDERARRQGAMAE